MVPMVEIHAPAVTHRLEVINKPIMVYDTKDNLINASYIVRSGISSEHSSTFTIWFDDGSHKHHMRRIFYSRQEAEDFLNHIYNIKE